VLSPAWGPAHAADCNLQINQAPPAVRIDYDSFVPASAPARLAFRISNAGDEACEADLAVVDSPGVAAVRYRVGTTGLGLEIRPSVGVTRAVEPSVFHVAVPAGEALETTFDVAVIEEEAHALISAAGTFGAAALRSIASSLEAACGARDTTKIAELRKGLPNLVEKSLAAFPMASGGAVNVGGND
jgi:hypothetical protein